MLAVLTRTWPLYVAMTLILMGLGFQNTILPIAGKNAGFANDMMGYVMSMYYLGFFFGVYTVPKLVQKVGHVRVFATLATLGGSILILYGVIENVLVWMLIRVIMGVCFSGLYLVTETWINDAVDNRNRGYALSIYLVLSYAGLMLGQFSIGFFEVGSLLPFVIISLILSLSFIPVLLSVNAEPKIDNNKPMSFKQTYNASPMGFLGLIFVGFGHAASFTIGGVYITSLGASATETSYFLMAGSIGSMIGLYPAGKISDMYDRRLVIVALCIIALFGVVLISIQDSVGNFLNIGFGIINLGLGPLYSVCVAQTNDWLDESERMSAAARLAFLYGMGSMGGSFSLSFLLGVVGNAVFIYAQIFIYGGLLAFAISRFFIRESQVDEEQATFIAYPSRATTIAMDVYDEDVYDNSSKEEE